MKSNSDGPRELDVCVSSLRELAAAFVCTATLLLHGLTPASAADIAILQAWSRATPNRAMVAAGYLTIKNRGNNADTLVSASTPHAAKAEIYEMIDVGGVMRMRPVWEGMTIPPNSKLVLAPVGSHLMFMELKAPFAEGDQIAALLDFERAGQISISVEVGGIGAKAPRPGIGSKEALRSKVSETEPFFTHIHDFRLMANVTVSPGWSGPVEVLVQLEDPQENVLAAEGLSITLSNSESGIVLITTTAECIASDTWRAQMLVSEAGKWSLALLIAMTSKEKVEITTPIPID